MPSSQKQANPQSYEDLVGKQTLPQEGVLARLEPRAGISETLSEFVRAPRETWHVGQ